MTKKKRHLVFLWNYLEWGGAQIYFLAIMKLAKQNWQVTVVLPGKSPPDILSFINKIGVEIEFIDVCLDSAPALTISRKLQRQWRRIYSEIYSFCYLLKFPARQTVFHVESAPWQSWIFLTALALRTNVFVTVHNALSKTSRWRSLVWKLRMKFLSNFNNFHILTANHDAKESLKGFVKKNFWETIKVTSASINPPEIEKVLNLPLDAEKLGEKYKLPTGKFIIFCAGQFIDRKGRWIFLKAAEELLKSNSDLAFVWLMPNLPQKEDWEKINRFELKNSFHPILSQNVGQNREDILSFMRIADLFVLPSLLEGLPISLLEAMALRKPCISTNINSVPEAIKHLETGWLVEPENVGELASAILELKNDSQMRNKLAENAGRFAIENFDERKMAKLAIAEYEKSSN